MLQRVDALRGVAEILKGFPCLVTVGMTWVYWDRFAPSEGNFALKTLGSGSSIGIGLALALPKQKIVVLDGDGAVLMNINGLITEGRSAPKNLLHIVFDNKVYEASGGIPSATSKNVDLLAIAKGVGIRKATAVTSLHDLIEVVQAALKDDGPHLIVVYVSAGDEQEFPSYSRIDDVDNKFQFMRFLESLEGRKLREDAIDIKVSVV